MYTIKVSSTLFYLLIDYFETINGPPLYGTSICFENPVLHIVHDVLTIDKSNQQEGIL